MGLLMLFLILDWQ